MPSTYCEAADLYDHGLPRGMLPNPAQLVASVDTASDTLELDGHGFRDDSELRFRAEAGGTLPAPLVAGTTYYAVVVDDSHFKVGTAPGGGSDVDLTTSGSNVVVITPLPFAAAIRWASATVDEMLPAHVVPLEAPYPETVIAVVAELAAVRMLILTGAGGQQDVTDRIARAQRVIDRWAKGIPIRGEVEPPAAGLAATAVVGDVDPRGWVPEGGTLP